MDFVNRSYVKFDEIKFIVLDEGDRMLDMGFLGEIEKIMGHPTITPQVSQKNFRLGEAIHNTSWPVSHYFFTQMVLSPS